MKIKFLKDYKFLRGFENDVKLTTTQIFKDAIIDTVEDEVPDEDVQWLIDNGFAEKVDEGVEWLYDGVPYYKPAVSGIARKFVPSYDEYRGDDVYDEARRRIGICYKSRAACQRFIDFLTAVETVRHDEGFMKYDKIQGEVWELRRAYLDSEEFFSACKIEYEGFHHLGAFYFDTEEHAIASSEKHHSEWETILNYDWSKGEDDNEED